MLSHQFYNVVHIVGIVLLAAALGGAAFATVGAGVLTGVVTRRVLASFHGVGLLLILIGGFGMLARLGFQHGAVFPGWLWVKLAVWATLAAAFVLVRRRPALAKLVLASLPILAGLAAYMAIYKPI